MLHKVDEIYIRVRSRAGQFPAMQDISVVFGHITLIFMLRRKLSRPVSTVPTFLHMDRGSGFLKCNIQVVLGVIRQFRLLR